MNEVFESLAVLAIVVYGLLLIVGGPTLANKVMGRVFRTVGRFLEKEMRRLAKWFFRLLFRGSRAAARGIGRGLRAAWRQFRRFVRFSVRRYPRASLFVCRLLWCFIAGFGVGAGLGWLGV